MKVVSVSVPLPSADDPNTMAPLARQHESLRRLGVEVTAVEIRGTTKFKYATTLRRLRQVLSGFDIVHAHYGYAGWLGRCQLSKPLVVSFMGSDLLGVPSVDGRISRSSAMVVRLDRWFARTADAVIVKSAEMAEIIEPVPSHVVPNGVDTDTFRPVPMVEARTALGWPETGIRVLFAGNPGNPRKGHRLAAASVAALSSLGVDDVELVALHNVSSEDVPLYMNACNAMIMTSLLEGSPNVVKEAMACDLPVVSVPVGDVETLFDGVDGYVIRPREAEELAVALCEAIGRPPSASGRSAIFAKGLDLQSVAGQVLAIYESVLR